jgi:SAM-dependent methyltransferase
MHSAQATPAETRAEAVARMTPPPEMDFVGGTDFEKTGNALLEMCRTHGGLQPHHRVLDVGSGIGRVAIPLTGFLGEQGSYEGFDIRSDGVQWCQQKITPRYPKFQFQSVSLSNSQYLPEGVFDAAEFHFPYPSRSFDFVILTSVFTHVGPEVVCNYLDEINRVLKRKGRVLATFFLYSPDAPDRAARLQAGIQFPHRHRHHRVMFRKNPAAAIAFEEPWVVSQFERRGLQLQFPTIYGFQDAVIAEKKQALPLKQRWRRLRRRLQSRWS